MKNHRKSSGHEEISSFLKSWLTDSGLDEKNALVFKSYYKSYTRSFSDRMQYFYRQQIADLLELLSKAPQANRRVLEIGCGTGTESLWLALSGAQVTAVDLKDNRLEVARARKKILEDELGDKLNVEFQKSSVLDLNESEKFDFIWMEQTFHHLEPRQDILKKLGRLLKGGGHVVVSESNALNPLLQLQLFKQRGLKTIVEFQDQVTGEKIVYGNERILSASQLKKNFEQVGIKEIKTKHFRLFPNSNLFSSLFSLEKNFPQVFRPVFTHYNFIGQKQSA